MSVGWAEEANFVNSIQGEETWANYSEQMSGDPEMLCRLSMRFS